MKKMNESRLLVTMVFGLMLGLLIIHPYNVMAAKPAGKDKKEVEANITHVHHLTLRGAYSEMPYTSLNPTALVMGGSLNLKLLNQILGDGYEIHFSRENVSIPDKGSLERIFPMFYSSQQLLQRDEPRNSWRPIWDQLDTARTVS